MVNYTKMLAMIKMVFLTVTHVRTVLPTCIVMKTLAPTNKGYFLAFAFLASVMKMMAAAHLTKIGKTGRILALTVANLPISLASLAVHACLLTNARMDSTAPKTARAVLESARRIIVFHLSNARLHIIATFLTDQDHTPIGRGPALKESHLIPPLNV